ncbi:LysE family transporter [Methylobacterium sp. R2-1]|uniref:LysE family translocator n=1 Tax=Methylobacterium sp. R2-1 TaxID=2587064 RepID=UPI0018278115|nr:LysE family transporter [Methylobacterium sp. R2-1]MBB2961105.1 threonine/homoserine/homoserine lactone efflux protein [Methylobacterium sp. R2-1]
MLARGTHGVSAFIAGFLVGDLLWFSVAATGFALLAQSFAALFIDIRYLGAAYLAYLAWRAWTAPVESIAGESVRGENGPRMFLGGLALTLGNPA